MDETGVILDLFDRAWRGPAWHGPSVREALDGVDCAEAAARPLAGAHTIGELAAHIIVWQDAVRYWLAGETFTVTPELDFPADAASDEASWARTRLRMQQSHDALRVAIAAFPAERLTEARVEVGVPWFVILHGVTHHALYHAGQIALLRRAARA